MRVAASQRRATRALCCAVQGARPAIDLDGPEGGGGGGANIDMQPFHGAAAADLLLQQNDLTDAQLFK